MYLPKSFEVTDSNKLADVLNRFSFATLITSAEGVPFPLVQSVFSLA